jgi:hypothetical protein
MSNRTAFRNCEKPKSAAVALPQTAKPGVSLLMTPGLPELSGQLGSACFALAAMFRRVLLASFLGVSRGVQVVPVRNVRMMPGLFGVTSFIMFGRFAMVMRGMFVVLGCALVMLRAFMFRHY